jgi:hypothetical protein
MKMNSQEECGPVDDLYKPEEECYVSHGHL